MEGRTPPRAAARPSARLRGSPPRGTCQHKPAADEPPGVVAHTGAGVKTEGSDASVRAESTTRRAHQRGHPSPSARNASRQAPPSAPDPQHKPASHSRQAGGAHLPTAGLLYLPTAGRGERRARLQPEHVRDAVPYNVVRQALDKRDGASAGHGGAVEPEQGRAATPDGDHNEASSSTSTVRRQQVTAVPTLRAGPFGCTSGDQHAGRAPHKR